MKAKKTTAPKAAKPTKATKARKATKPAAAPKAKPATKAAKPVGQHAAIEEAARRGRMPAPPDFSAATHARFRRRLAELIALAEAGDMKGLRAFPINPTSTSPKAMDRYRNLCVVALSARQTADA